MGEWGKRGKINKIKKFLNKEEKDKRGMEDLEERTGQGKISRSGGFLARALSGIYAIVLAASLWGCGPYQKAQTEEAISQPAKTRHEEKYDKIIRIEHGVETGKILKLKIGKIVQQYPYIRYLGEEKGGVLIFEHVKNKSPNEKIKRGEKVRARLGVDYTIVE